MTVTGVDANDDDVYVREAVRADLLAVYRIEKASFPQPWPFSSFERFLDTPGFLVAERPETGALDGGVVGYIVADTVPSHGNPLGHVKDIAVHPDCRGEGIGKRLLSRALDALGAQNASSVKLEVRESNDPAIRLYRQFGFEHRKRIPGYYEDGEDALVMVRPV